MIPPGLPAQLPAFCTEMQADADKIQAPANLLPTCGQGEVGVTQTRVKLQGVNYVYVYEGDQAPKVIIAAPDKNAVLERVFYDTTLHLAVSTNLGLAVFAHPDGSAMSKPEETSLFTTIYKSQDAILRKLDPVWAEHAAQKNADNLQSLQKGKASDE